MLINNAYLESAEHQRRIAPLFQERAPWTDGQCDAWASQQVPVKQYNDLMRRIENAAKSLRQKGIKAEINVYGKITAFGQDCELLRVDIGDVSVDTIDIFSSGGVHGYEPSGEDACIHIIETNPNHTFNEACGIIYPCVNPAAYIINHRWNNFGNDQNRMFNPNLLTTDNSSTAERNQEAVLLMQDIANMGKQFKVAGDYHEAPIADILLRCDRAERYGSALSPDYTTLPDASYFYIGEESVSTDENSQIIMPDVAYNIASAMKQAIPMAQDEFIIGSKNHGNGIAISKTENTLRHFMSEYANISITTEVCPYSIYTTNIEELRKEKAIGAQVAAFTGLTQHL